MTEADLNTRALSNVSGGKAQLDPLTLLILGALLSAVISHFAQKCLNNIDPVTVRSPGPIRRWQFRRLVREKCGDPSVLQAAVVDRLDASGIDKAFGDIAYNALLKTGSSLTEPEIVGLCGR